MDLNLIYATPLHPALCSHNCASRAGTLTARTGNTNGGVTEIRRTRVRGIAFCRVGMPLIRPILLVEPAERVKDPPGALSRCYYQLAPSAVVIDSILLQWIYWSYRMEGLRLCRSLPNLHGFDSSGHLHPPSGRGGHAGEHVGVQVPHSPFIYPPEGISRHIKWWGGGRGTIETPRRILALPS